MNKKFFPILITSLFTIGAYAQENELKNFRFGGDLVTSLSWYKPDNLKKFASGGVTPHLGGGLTAEFRLASNFAFNFGLQIVSDGGKVTFTDTASYYFSNDGFITISDTNGLMGKYEAYKLNERKYKATYFNIPFGIKMRTKEIGMMRYFLQIGFNTGIRKKVKVNDELTSLKTKQSTSQTDLDNTKDMAILKFSANFYAGAEYYISGSTALVFGLGYDYGLSNIVQKKSEYLLRNGNPPPPLEQKFNANAVQLHIGVLF